MSTIDRRDVLMYIKSADVIQRVMPQEAHHEVMRAITERGYATLSPTTIYGGSRLAGYAYDAGNFGGKPVRAKEIPEAEEEAICRAWDAVREKGKTLHVVDVGRESGPRRLIEEHLHHLRDFPVLVRPDGRRLEGSRNFNATNLEKFLSD